MNVLNILLNKDPQTLQIVYYSLLKQVLTGTISTQNLVLFLVFSPNLNMDLKDLVLERYSDELETVLGQTMCVLKQYIKRSGKGKSATNNTNVQDVEWGLKTLHSMIDILSFDKVELELLDLLNQIYETRSPESKQLILSILHNWLTYLSLKDSTKLGPFFMRLLDITTMTETPLLLDCELNFRFSDLLADFEDTRLDFIIESLRNLVVFSGTSYVSQAVSHSSSSAPIANPSDKETRLIQDISTVQDLFPYGSAFIKACLDIYGTSESVIMHILEDSLDPGLMSLDRNLELQRSDSVETLGSGFMDAVDEDETKEEVIITKGDTNEDVLKDRKNVFDGDKYDIFSQPFTNYHIGKANYTDTDSERRSFIKDQKAKILEWAKDEDEYVDTYDTLSTVPLGQSDDIESESLKAVKKDAVESYLVSIYQSTPSYFHPSSRKSSQRMEMKEKTKWTDEQIEGWFVMLNRRPDKERYLLEFEFDGNQADIHTPKSQSTKPKVNSSRGRGSPRGRGKPKRGQRIAKFE